MKLLISLTILSIVGLELFANSYISKKQIQHYKENYGKNAAQRLKNWNSLMVQKSNSTNLQKARSIDAYFNQYRYRHDYKFDSQGNKYQAEFFRSFEEFVGAFGGDCDDYVIVKYYSLLKLGIPENKLQIWVGGYKSDKINHAVLAFYIDDSTDPLILDSNTRWAVRYSERTNFKPWFYANSSNSGVFHKTLKKHKETKQINSYEMAADYMMLKIDRWLRLHN